MRVARGNQRFYFRRYLTLLKQMTIQTSRNKRDYDATPINRLVVIRSNRKWTPNVTNSRNKISRDNILNYRLSFV